MRSFNPWNIRKHSHQQFSFRKKTCSEKNIPMRKKKEKKIGGWVCDRNHTNRLCKNIYGIRRRFIIYEYRKSVSFSLMLFHFRFFCYFQIHAPLLVLCGPRFHKTRIYCSHMNLYIRWWKRILGEKDKWKARLSKIWSNEGINEYTIKIKLHWQLISDVATTVHLQRDWVKYSL